MYPFNVVNELILSDNMWDLVHFSIFSFAVSAIAATASDLAALYPFLRCRYGHWVEKARRAYPARLTANVNPFLLSAFFGTFGWTTHPLSPVSYLLAGIIAPYLGSLIPGIYVERTILERPCKISDFLKSHLSIWLLFYYPLWILILLISLPWKLTSLGYILHGTIFLVYCALATGGTLQIARILGLAKTASSRLNKLMDETSRELGVKVRCGYELSWVMVNALVYPFTKVLVVSTAAMENLTDKELKGILKHEFGHLAEPFSIILLRMSGLIFLFLLFSIKQVYGTFGIIGVLLTLLISFSGAFLINLLARRMEVNADTFASTEDDGTYAQTLEKIYRLNMLPAVNRSRKTPHPDLFDRMSEAGVKPEYPRPKPPSRLTTYLTLVLSLLISFSLMIFY